MAASLSRTLKVNQEEAAADDDDDPLLSLKEPLLSPTNGDSSVMMEQERQQRHNSVLLQDEALSSLLQRSENATAEAVCAAWPRNAAERVRLLLPEEYKTRQEKQQQENNELYCHLRYDAERRLLLVVMSSENDSDDEETLIIDVIDPNDLIGADMSLEIAAISEATFTSPYSPTSDASSPRDSSGRDERGGDDSEDVYDENYGTNHRRATNEPPTDSLHDHRGHAILSLYVYPRRNPKDASWLQWMGITSPSASPSPPARLSLTEFLEKYDNDKEQQEALMQGQPRYAHFRKFQLAPAEDLGDSSRLLTALRRLADASSTKPSRNKKKYLIIVNPKSGPKKNGATICHTMVEPMLQQAGIETHVIITSHPRHAQELMAMNHSEKANDNHGDIVDVSNYHGVILMGGDGIIFEVLNGIMARPDAHDVWKKITLGIVGCGSCNGLAATIMNESKEALSNSVINQVFVIAKGYNQVCMDISRYQTATTDSSRPSSPASYYYSFLTFAYGMIADIDIESELLHCLGEVRVDIWAVWRVLFLRHYRARFSYLPPPPPAAARTTKSSRSSNLLPDSLTDPLPPNGDQGWKVLSNDDNDDGIILFWASQVSHAAMHTHQAPDSHLQDGLFKVMIVRNNASRFQVARILLGLESGSHVNMTGVEFIDCIAYRLEPLDTDDKKKELNVLDGEVIESGPIQAQVLPSMVRIFCNSKSYIETTP